jgi:molecular chaperone Hsp33
LDDLVQPFYLHQAAVRGRLVRLGPSVDAILARHAYPEPVAVLLGEAMALATALAGSLKYDGVFTLQAKGDGPVRLLVADITSDGNLRGYAQFDAEKVAAAEAGPVRGAVPRLLGSGYLVFTVDQGGDTDRYQGIVALDGTTLTDCIHHYFRQSEQIDTALLTACSRQPDGWRSGALMLQRMPRTGGFEGETEHPAFSEAEEDDWRRLMLLQGTASARELTDPALPPEQLLFRLFHEEGDTRLPAAQPVRDRCRCSSARVAAVLRSLPVEEVETLKEEDGKVRATCEFCSATYIFGDQELADLRTLSA